MMRYTYCPDCGTKLGFRQAGDDGLVPYCEPCEKYWFDSFHSCIIAMVVNEEKEIALLDQAHLSTQFKTFVSGYITPGETAEECAQREIFEELGLELESLEMTGTYWFERRGQLMHCFLAKAKKQDFNLSCEIQGAQWVHYEEAISYFPQRKGSAMPMLYELYLKKLEEGQPWKPL